MTIKNSAQLARVARVARGFTLIELMIVVVIIGILTALVLPSYQSSVLKSRRADGRAALTNMAARQEKFFAQNNSYTTTVSAVGSGLGVGKTTSPDDYYNLSVAACAGGAITRCYLLSAVATGAQTDDVGCTTLSLDSVGRKTAKDSGGTASTLCW